MPVKTPATLAERLCVGDGALQLVPYVMAGHPDSRKSLETICRLADLGVGAIEIGIPYGDPLADGPVIQRAGQRALAMGTTVQSTLQLVADVTTETDVAFVLMTYVNPVLAYGARRFARDAAGVGVAGVIVVDLPYDEPDDVVVDLREAGLDTVFLVAPTSPEHRIRAACEASRGFVYCVTRTGTTGARCALPSELPKLLGRVRAHTSLPLAAGFGISTPAQVTALKGHADAIVVGSAIVAELDAGGDVVPLVERLLAACR